VGFWVDQVGEVVASIPAAQGADTIVLTQTYQQARRSTCSGPRAG
jgi:hypothetical protein